MSERAELYLLFPVSAELENDNEPLYLNRISIVNVKDVDLLYDRILENQLFFNNENYYGYFDSKNLEAYLYPIKVLGDDCYPSRERRIRLLVNRWGTDWRKTKKINSINQCFNCTISDDTLSVVAEKKVSNPENSFLILDCDAIKNSESIKVSLGISGYEIKIDKHKLDIQGIAEWFRYNRRPRRIYKHNPKHGENGKGQMHNKGENVSVLMCSIEEATEMLHMATKIDEDNKSLYYYDNSRSKYIAFKCDNYIKQSYHAYHTDNEKEVPEEVKKKLKIILI
ncbi:MAG: hypothetical protein R3Y26_09710 [Rikenellaceae bacterium]